MKVLFITSHLKKGGAEVFLHELVKELSKIDNINIIIVSGSSVGVSDYSKYSKIYIVPNTKFYFQEWLLGLSDPLIEKRVKRIIKNERPDIIHLNNFLGLGPAVINACSDVSIPVVVTVHDYWPLCPKTTFIYAGKGKAELSCHDIQRCLKNECVRFINILPWLNYLLVRRFDNFRERILNFLESSVVVAVSNYVKRILEKYGLSNVHVIYNGGTFSEINFSYESWRNRSYILYLGGSKFEKGYHVVKKILENIFSNNLQELFSKYTFVIRSGESLPCYPGLKLVTSSFFQDVQDYFIKSFITLIPSRWHETLSYTAIEAIAYGSLVLAFNVGGVKEVVLDSYFLVDPRSIEAFYEKFIEIMKSDTESLYEKLRIIRNYVLMTFNAKRMSRDYYNLYMKLIDREK